MTETTTTTEGKPESPIVFDKMRGELQKISINVLGRDPNNLIFTIPVEGMILTAEQLDRLMGAYTFRSWFNKTGDMWEPMPWHGKRKNGDYLVDGKFACADLTIEVNGGEQLGFETRESDEEDGDDIPAAIISHIRLTPQRGGTTLMSCHVQIRPEIGRANNVLQEHMFRSVLLSISECAEVVGTKGSQQALAVETPPQTKATSTEPEPQQQLGLESAASAGSDQVTAETDAKLDAAIGRPPPVESRGGDAIDAELHSRHPEASGEVMGDDAHPDPDATNPTSEGEAYSEGGGIPANGGMDPDLESELQGFEDEARKKIEAFSSVSQRGVIDGRSERVKHQDAQKGEAA